MAVKLLFTFNEEHGFVECMFIDNDEIVDNRI